MPLEQRQKKLAILIIVKKQIMVETTRHDMVDGTRQVESCFSQHKLNIYLATVPYFQIRPPPRDPPVSLPALAEAVLDFSFFETNCL